MQKDTTQKELEAYNDVFADICNVAVFGGKEVLKEEDLVPLPTESYTRNTDGTTRQGFRDVRKADRRNGRYHLIIGLENQTGVDYTMPERVMGYEYASYEEQIKVLMAKNRTEKKPAVTKRLHEEQRLAPVVTTVIYWGEKEWTGPRCLHDMLEFPPEMEKEIRPFVADYPIHLLEMAALPEEVRSSFQSDFRILAEYAASRENAEKWERFMETYQKAIVHPEELLDTLSALSGDSRYTEVKEKVIEKECGEEKGEVRMCEVAEKLEQRGIQKGIQQGIQQGIQEGIREGVRRTMEICLELGIAKEQVIDKVMEKYALSREDAEKEMERCWG